MSDSEQTSNKAPEGLNWGAFLIPFFWSIFMRFINKINISIFLDTLIISLISISLSKWFGCTFKDIANSFIFFIIMLFLLLPKNTKIRIVLSLLLVVLIINILYPLRNLDYYVLIIFSCFFFVAMEAQMREIELSAKTKSELKKRLFYNIIISILIIIIALPFYSNTLNNYTIFLTLQRLSLPFLMLMSLSYTVCVFINPKIAVINKKFLCIPLSVFSITMLVPFLTLSSGKEYLLTDKSIFYIIVYFLLCIFVAGWKGYVMYDQSEKSSI